MNSDNLKEYAERVNRLVTKFGQFTVEKVDQSHSEVGDKLTKIASRESPNEAYPALQ